MESSPVSYGTFEAVTLQHGSLSSNFKLARDLLKNRTAQARAAMLWIIISACFVLAFPTILSAMSGYSANIGSFVEVDDGTMVPYSNFTLVRYIVHDAHRIDDSLGKDYMVTTGGNGNGGGIVHLEDYQYSDYCTDFAYPHQGDNATDMDWSDTDHHPICKFYWHVSEYAYNYGFLGLNQTKSIFNNSGKLVNLTEPSLNITAFFWKQDWIVGGSSDGSDWWDWPFGYYWISEDQDKPFHNFTDPLFTNDQYVYELEELNLRGRCQQANTSYRWGFSFLILFWFVILSLVWSVGMYVLWLDAYFHSRFDRAGRSMGLQRAILDLAYCMQKDVDEEGREMLSNPKLQRKIRRDLKGGRITYEMLEEKLLPVSRATASRMWWRETNKKDWLNQFLKRKGWTFAFFVGSLGFLSASIAGAHTPLITAVFLAYGSGTVLFMNERHKSRWLIFLACAVLAIVFAPIGPYVYMDKDHYAVVWLRTKAFAALPWWYKE